MEMSASPTALQDNSYKARENDRNWPTKEALRDRVRLTATIEWVGTKKHHCQRQRLS